MIFKKQNCMKNLLVKKIFGVESQFGDPSMRNGMGALAGSLIAAKLAGRALNNVPKIASGIKGLDTRKARANALAKKNRDLAAAAGGGARGGAGIATNVPTNNITNNNTNCIIFGTNIDFNFLFNASVSSRYVTACSNDVVKDPDNSPTFTIFI